ncbi:MAG TPA: aldehyde dehydrogenase family protein, partial [Flavobacteriaceae bacterium]|nr:aldehyde dehydrogenase family protein [Flavobacteriaceae bacterium]
MSTVATDFGMDKALEQLGLKDVNHGTSTGNTWYPGGAEIASHSPVDGALIGKVTTTTKDEYEKVIAAAQDAFKSFRAMPAPQRGEIVRQFGNKLRELKEPLGKLVSYEMGKSLQEGYGEVQEMIDICDFAVGLSRQLNGQTIPSERPGHVMREQWHSLGIVGIISAFNFPVAVWAWNTALAWVCGDVCVWKGSEKAPLCTVACQNIIAGVLKDNDLPEGISSIINGDYKVGEWMTQDTRIPLISATGSTRMGRIVGKTVAERFGKSLLELGGNNAIIITPTADLKVVVPGAVFGAVGTCGQRCTSTRRLIIHESVYDKVKDAIVGAYKQIVIGNPLDENNHVGPLIDKDAVDTYLSAIEKAKAEGGNVLVEGGVLEGEGYESGCYVKPAIIEAENSFEIVQHETFAPILYLMKYSGDVENA